MNYCFLLLKRHSCSTPFNSHIDKLLTTLGMPTKIIVKKLLIFVRSCYKGKGTHTRLYICKILTETKKKYLQFDLKDFIC